MWDKLCLRTQAVWERETVERLWSIVECIWNQANIEMEALTDKAHEDVEIDMDKVTWVERVLVDYGWTVSNPKLETKGISTIHPIFEQEIEALTSLIHSKPKPSKLQAQLPTHTLESISSLYSLLKLGHIVSTVTVNLQTQGFCVRDEEQGEGEGEDGELQAGMGMAEGEIAEGARNAGD